MNVPTLPLHERIAALTGLLQDIHAMRAELNRLENIVQELKGADHDDHQTHRD